MDRAARRSHNRVRSWRTAMSAGLALAIGAAPVVLTPTVTAGGFGLRSASGTAHGRTLAAVTVHDVESVLRRAAAEWDDPSLTELPVRVVDLPGDLLALTTATGIAVDPTAAGHGWFVDPTPGLDDEFVPAATGTGTLARNGGRRADGPAHGGRPRARPRARAPRPRRPRHHAGALMAGELAVGERRVDVGFDPGAEPQVTAASAAGDGLAIRVEAAPPAEPSAPEPAPPSSRPTTEPAPVVTDPAPVVTDPPAPPAPEPARRRSPPIRRRSPSRPRSGCHRPPTTPAPATRHHPDFEGTTTSTAPGSPLPRCRQRRRRPSTPTTTIAPPLADPGAEPAAARSSRPGSPRRPPRRRRRRSRIDPQPVAATAAARRPSPPSTWYIPLSVLGRRPAVRRRRLRCRSAPRPTRSTRSRTSRSSAPTATTRWRSRQAPRCQARLLGAIPRGGGNDTVTGPDDVASGGRRLRARHAGQRQPGRRLRRRRQVVGGSGDDVVRLIDSPASLIPTIGVDGGPSTRWSAFVRSTTWTIRRRPGHGRTDAPCDGW